MPRDFRKKTFQKTLRGYSPEEVDAYLSFVNSEYQKLEKRNNENERKLALAIKKNEAFEFEMNKNSPDLKTAEELAEPVRIAEKKAEEIVAAAKMKADAIIHEATKQAAAEAEKITEEAVRYSENVRVEADGMAKTADAMYNEIMSFRDTMFELYNSHIEQVEEFVNRAENFSERVDSLYTPDGAYDEQEESVEVDDAAEYDESEDTAESYEPEETAEPEPVVSGNDIYIDLDDIEEEDYIDSENYDEEYESDETVEEVTEISEDDRIRRRQLDRFFGILDDDELLEADDEDSDFEPDNSATRVLDMGSTAEVESDFESDNGREYVDMDSLFEGKGQRDMSLTDEFDIVYSDKSAKQSVDEIRRQPTVAASTPQKKSNKHLGK